MFKLLPPLLTVLLACCLSGSLAAQAPANDDCADAIAIGAGEFTFSTIDATTDGPSHPNDCPSSGATPDSTYKDIWYLFTPTFTGFAKFSTCSTADFDTKIFVYNPGAACPPTDDDVLACNEDGPGCTSSTSLTIFAVTEGMSYLLRLGGWGDGPPGEVGMGTFSVQEHIFSGAPANDLCADAIGLVLGPQNSVVVEYTTDEAVSDGPTHTLQSCFDPGETQVHNNVWYTFTPNFTGWMEWSNCDIAGYDSRVAIYASTACPPDPETLVGCSDDGISEMGNNCGGFTSRAIFPVEAGVTYSISVGGWSSSDVGDGTFVLKETEEPVYLTNDNCATPDTAYVITPEQADAFDALFPGNTLQASWDDTQIRPSCRTGEHWDLWYKFNTGVNGELDLRFNKLTTDANFIIDIFTTCGEPVTGPEKFCIRTDQIAETFFTKTLIGFTGIPTEYLLRVTTRVTTDKPGEFWFQLVGDPYDPPTSVNETFLSRFSFAPNPAKDKATVQFEMKESAANGRWSISNTLGQVVSEQDLGQLAAGPHELKVPLDRLDNGVYFFLIKTDNGQRTVRFVKE